LAVPPETEDSRGRLAKSRYLDEMRLNRLNSTEFEARIIESLVPADQRFVARGFNANRASATDPALAGYRYLHFATHARVNTDLPGIVGDVSEQL
jgi:CHAT domain-containing protein